MKHIILIRHGALDDALKGRYIGATDAPLSAEGVEQLAAVGRILDAASFGNVHASPMLRVRQSVEAAGVSPDTVHWDDRLRETSFGECEKHTYAEIIKRFPTFAEEWRPDNFGFTFPGGENVGAFRARVRSFLDEIHDRKPGAVTVFTHGGVINTLLEFLLDIPCTEIWRYAPQRGSISVVRLSESGHASLRLLNYLPSSLEQGAVPWQP